VNIPEARSLMCNINTKVSKLMPWEHCIVLSPNRKKIFLPILKYFWNFLIT